MSVKMAENLPVETGIDPKIDAPADDSAAKGYIPEGYSSQEEFLTHVRKTFADDASYDRMNRDWALEDLKFAAGDQWDAETKAEREDRGRPCLTINVLPQFIGQVIGDRRLNKTAIKVRPFKDGTQQIADIRTGLIRSIEAYSRADRVYDAVCEDQVTCGIGNFRIDLEYSGNDVFDQDIMIRAIPNPLGVIWDRMSVDPTGRDARHCFVTDAMPKDVYDEKFPDNPCPSQLGDEQITQGWFENNVVRLTEFWELVDKPATFALMIDGDVKDVTGKPREEYEENLWKDPTTGKPKIRESFRTYARMHLVTGFAILGEAYEIPLTRLPIIRVEGRTIRVGEDRVRFGLVRYAKDSQRLKNYWRSTAAEAIALAPKAQWIADAAAVEKREDDFRDSHRTGDPLLVVNKGHANNVKRVDPPPVPAALIQEAQMNQQDIKDTTGLHDASLGVRSNEVSGKAIQARQREGDVATVVFHDNVNAAIQEGGDVINQLIPLAYDATRTIRTIEEDDKHVLMVINDPNDINSPNITVGKYDITLDTGPNFTTQRMEALDTMMTLLQTSPDLMAIAGDIAAKNMDWPGAHEFGERLKKWINMSSPGLLSEEEGGGEAQPSPEQQQEMAMAQQMQQAQLAEAAAQLEHAAKMREAELLERQQAIAKAEADARAADANAQIAEARAREAEAKANIAETQARTAPLEALQRLDHTESANDMQLSHQEQAHGQKIQHNERSQRVRERTPKPQQGKKPAKKGNE